MPGRLGGILARRGAGVKRLSPWTSTYDHCGSGSWGGWCLSMVTISSFAIHHPLLTAHEPRASLGGDAAHARIERVAQAVAEAIEAHDGYEDRETGEERHVRRFH